MWSMFSFRVITTHYLVWFIARSSMTSSHSCGWILLSCDPLLFPSEVFTFIIVLIIFCFLYQIFVNFWRQKNPNSKMVHRRKISTTEVRGNKRFFYTQSGVGFWFQPLFGKMIAAPPGWSTFRENFFIWVNSVIIHSLKNMFKVPGGIRWQFFSSSNEEWTGW